VAVTSSFHRLRPFAPPASPCASAAMIYEAVLLFGVVFIMSYALLAVLQWQYPLPPGPRTVLQALLWSRSAATSSGAGRVRARRWH